MENNTKDFPTDFTKYRNARASTYFDIKLINSVIYKNNVYCRLNMEKVFFDSITKLRLR